MNVIEGRFDKRATHRIFSEPVALDMVNDLSALVEQAISDAKRGRWLAVATGLVRMRQLARTAAGLVEESVPIDPYRAVEAAA